MCQSGSNTKTLKNCIFKKMFKMKAIFQNFVYIVRNQILSPQNSLWLLALTLKDLVGHLKLLLNKTEKL